MLIPFVIDILIGTLFCKQPFVLWNAV